MKFNIVDILNTGVTGFAFVMLYLGYRLTSSVQSKILDKNLEDFQTIDYFREWKDLVRSQLNNTRYFMLFAALFFAGGLALLVYQAESEIIIAISPIESSPPKITHQADEVELVKNNMATIIVKSGHKIDVHNDKLMKQINELKLNNENKKNVVREISKEITSNSRGAGLSLD